MLKENAITAIPLFRGLSQKQLDELVRTFPRERHGPGEVIFTEGEEANGFYILLAGMVKVYKLSPEGKEQILHIIGPGEPFAEVALFSEMVFPEYFLSSLTT